MKYVLLVSAILSALVACKETDKKSEAVADVRQLPEISKNSNEFNQAFRGLLTTYYQLKDALVLADTVKANVAAASLQLLSDSLMTKKINDSTGDIKSTASNYTGTISGSANALAGETTLENKRKEFQMISDALYDLIRTVRYDEQTIYHQFCPMAFNNEGAFWLSNSREVVNPYFGNKMLHCGEVKDSLSFK